MKKGIALVILMLMFMSMLLACGNSGGSTGSTPASGSGGTTGSTSSSGSSGSTGSTPPSSGSATNSGTGTPVSTVKYADEITIITDGLAVAHLDPSKPGTSTGGFIYTLKCGWDRLIYRDEKGQYFPMLATEWGSDDLQTWTFKLRNDVTFHNGEKFTAQDVVYTINRMKANMGTLGYGIWGFVDTVNTPDDYTLEIILTSPNVEFEFFISQGEAIIVNEKAITDDPENGHLIGTGCFTIKEFIPNNYWVLERNDNYWGEKAITKTLIFRQITEASTQTMMMLNGEAQIAVMLPPSDLELFIDNPKYEVFHHNMPNPMPICFNMSDPITGDKNFRYAVAAATRRDEIGYATQIYYSLPEDGVMGPYFMPFRNTSIPMFPEDIEKAKEYLAASSYKGETVTITAYLSVTSAELLQQQLSEIGIKTEIVQTDPAGLPAFVAWDNNITQILVASYAIGQNESGLRNLLYPRMNYNRQHYENPRVTELFDKVILEPDKEKRREMHYEIQSIVADDLPYYNLYYGDRFVIGAKGIGGFTIHPDVFYDFRYVYWQKD